MASGSSEGNFRISNVPVAFSEQPRGLEAPEAGQSPLPGGTPLLFAIPRNPRTLFVCWSVDWSATFGSDVPADRKAHVRLRSATGERTYAAEPLSGHCAIPELEPGMSYAVELGYHGANELWRVIAEAAEVIMPLISESAEDEMEVATIPFHLSFQRMLDLLGASDVDLARHLSRVQEGAVEGRHSPGLSRENADKTAQRKHELTRPRQTGERPRAFAGVTSSSAGSSWQAS